MSSRPFSSELQKTSDSLQDTEPKERLEELHKELKEHTLQQHRQILLTSTQCSSEPTLPLTKLEKQTLEPDSIEQIPQTGRLLSVELPPSKRRCVRSLSIDSTDIETFKSPIPLMPGPHADVNYISPDILVDLMAEKYSDYFDSVLVFDCRYPYEYQGGHVDGAINSHIEEDIIRRLLMAPERHRRCAIVFYCEFSSQRAPGSYRQFRKYDRQINIYPQLHFPHLFVLNGGYREFFAQRPDQCVPREYVEMKDKRFEDLLVKYLKERKQTQSLRRSNSVSNFVGLLGFTGSSSLDATDLQFGQPPEKALQPMKQKRKQR